MASRRVPRLAPRNVPYPQGYLLALLLVALSTTVFYFLRPFLTSDQITLLYTLVIGFLGSLSAPVTSKRITSFG